MDIKYITKHDTGSLNLEMDIGNSWQNTDP